MLHVMLLYQMYLFVALVLQNMALTEAKAHVVLSNIVFVVCARAFAALRQSRVLARAFAMLAFLSATYHYLQVTRGAADAETRVWQDLDHAMTVACFGLIFVWIHGGSCAYVPTTVLVLSSLVFVSRRLRLGKCFDMLQWYELLIAVLVLYSLLRRRLRPRHAFILAVALWCKSACRGDLSSHYVAHTMWHVFCAYVVLQVTSSKKNLTKING